MKVYIIIEDCGNDETRNVACLATEEEAKAFCDERNKSKVTNPFSYEDWEIGEVLGEEVKHQEPPKNIYLDEGDLDKLEDILDNITYARESHCIYADGCIYLSDILKAADFIREHGKTDSN